MSDDMSDKERSTITKVILFAGAMVIIVLGAIAFGVFGT
jgi:hypothetical protein